MEMWNSLKITRKKREKKQDEEKCMWWNQIGEFLKNFYFWMSPKEGRGRNLQDRCCVNQIMEIQRDISRNEEEKVKKFD